MTLSPVLNPLSSPIADPVTTIDERRRVHADLVGKRAALIGVVLAIVAVPVDIMFRSYSCLIADIVMALGCALSLWMSKKREWKFKLGYFGFWLAFFPALLYSGKAFSPYFDSFILILFLSAFVGQNVLSVRSAVIFTAANYLFWITLSELLPHWPVQAVLPSHFFLFKKLLLSLGAAGFIFYRLKTEEEWIEKFIGNTRELQETRGALTQSSKMAEVGTLIAATSHELAQPVQVIFTSVSLLSRAHKKGTLDAQMLELLLGNLHENCNRMSKLLGQLRDFSRKDPFDAQLMDCNEAVRALYTMARLDSNAQAVEFDLQLSTEPLWINGDRNKIQQIFLNLINNARDHAAFSETPRVGIRTEEYRDWVRVSVQNNGSTIPSDVQQKIFTPYFTTKKKGTGTGLGLSICAQLVEAHHGRLYFSSQNEETHFVVDFPRAKAGSIVTGLKKGLNTGDASVAALEARPTIL